MQSLTLAPPSPLVSGGLGSPEVPEEDFGQGLAPPGQAATGPLPFNGHGVNPLKAHPLAAGNGQFRGQEGEGGRRERETGRESEEKKERSAGREARAGRCSCTSRACGHAGRV